MDTDYSNNNAEDFKHSKLTHTIILAAYDVHGDLGAGFLEKVYENALRIRLQELNIQARQQFPIQVKFHDHLIGEYVADLMVEDKVIVELKAVEKLQPVHEVQLVNYLKATGIEIGLLINFAQKVEVKRRIWTGKT